MTLIVCPNLAIDRVLLAARLEPGNLHRLRCLQHQAGGKGANVARVLKALGGRGLLVGVAAGSTGRLIGELAAAEGLDVMLVAADGEARVSNVIIEGDGRVTEVYEHGPGIDPATVTALLETVREQAGADDGWAIVNGHAPPGAGPDFYARLVGVLRSAGRRVMIDAAGPQLGHALAARPDFVKVNALEACSAVGDPAAAGSLAGDPAADHGAPGAATALGSDGAGGLTPRPTAPGGGPGEAAAALTADEAGAADAPPALIPADHGDCDAVSATLDDPGRVARGLELCRRLVAAGAGRAAVTIGAAGAVALAGGAVYHVRTEPVNVISTVGSGDSFAARLLLGLERGEDLGAALAEAAAAASANAASPFTAHLDPHEVARLAAGATVRVDPL